MSLTDGARDGDGKQNPTDQIAACPAETPTDGHTEAG